MTPDQIELLGQGVGFTALVVIMGYVLCKYV